MSTKKVSEFTKVTTSQPSDLFLINQAGTTSTIAMSTLSSTVLNGLDSTTAVGKLSSNFIKKPDTANIGDVLTYSSTGTWVASGSQFTGTTNQLLSSNGYQKLPGGLIIQWGTFSINILSVNTWTSKSVNFPIPFTNEVVCIKSNTESSLVGTISPAGTTGTDSTSIDSKTLSGFKQWAYDTTQTGSNTFTFLAIGY